MTATSPFTQRLDTIVEAAGKVSVHQAIAAVMADVGAIEKSRRNDSQGYSFRGIDDFYQALHDPMAAQGVFTVPEVLNSDVTERTNKNGTVLRFVVLTVHYAIYGPAGDHVDAVVMGEAMDSGDKAFNKALAAAHKYCLTQLFMPPVEHMADADQETHELAPPPPPVDWIHPGTVAKIREAIKALTPEQRAARVDWPTVFGVEILVKEEGGLAPAISDAAGFELLAALEEAAESTRESIVDVATPVPDSAAAGEAPDPPTSPAAPSDAAPKSGYAELNLPELRAALTRRALDPSGTKKEMIARLVEADLELPF